MSPWLTSSKTLYPLRIRKGFGFRTDDSLLVGQGWDLKLTEVPMSGFVVQPEFIQLGNGRDINGAFPCVPRNSWAKFGPELIPTYKVDLYLNMIHRENGWGVKFLEGITVFHDRDDDVKLEAHRK